MFVPPFSEHLTCSFQPQPADGSFPHVSSNLGFFRSIQHQSTGKQDLETPTRRWRLQPGSSWWWFFSLFLFLEVKIPLGGISLAFDDFGCWFVFLRLGKLPKLESNSHQKPYKFPLPILVGTKALLGICSPLQSSGFFSLIHQGEDRTELVCSEGWNSISFECLEEQEHEVADGHQGAIRGRWWGIEH